MMGGEGKGTTRSASGSGSTLTKARAEEETKLGRAEPQWLARPLRLLDSTAGAAGALTLLILLAFSPWWAGGKFFAPLDLLGGLYEPWRSPNDPIEVENHFTSDGVTQYIIYRQHAARSFAEDGRIGWSSLTDGGRPEYANTMAGYDDWAMQLHRFFDFWTAWHLGLFGQFLIAGLGFFFFLRTHRLAPLIALMGAVVYVLNSQFIYTFFHRWHLTAFAWVPWVGWAIYRYRDGAQWAWPLVPLSLALALVGGSLQTSAYVGIAFLVLWLSAEWRKGVHWGRAIGRLLIWGGLGLGIAGFVLFPSVLTLYEGLALGLDRGSIGYERGWRQPLTSAPLILLQMVPSLLGSPRSMDLAKVLGLELTDIAFFGLIPLILAYRTALIRTAPLGARLAIGLGLLIPLTPLVGPLYHRVQLLFAFGGAWAFSWYWTYAARDRVEPVLRWVGRLALAGLGAWILLSILSLLFEARLQESIDRVIAGRIAAGGAGQFGEYRGEWFRERGRLLLPELRIWNPRQLVVVFTGALGFAALYLRTRYTIRTTTLLLLSALLLELGVFAGSWINIVDPETDLPYPETPDIIALREIVGTGVGAGRVYIIDDPEAPSFFPPNTLAAYGIATIQAYETVAYRGMWAESGYTSDPERLGPIGVTHAVARPTEELGAGWVPEYRGESLTLWRNEFAVPRYLASSDDDGEREISLEVRGTENARRLVLPPGTTRLRIAENWGEGWRYRIDQGAWYPVEMEPDRAMAIYLEPADEARELELEYQPIRRKIGWRITLAALTLLTISSLWAMRYSVESYTLTRGYQGV